VEVRVTTLSENTANHGFLAEWGLSILIEVNESKILMDTGFSFSATYNAQLLGNDLTKIDTIVISHGHRDHTGGLLDVLKRKRGEVEIVAHPDIWENKYTRLDKSKKEHYSGIPFCRELLESLGARFVLSEKPAQIGDRIMTTGEIPMLSGYEKVDDGLLAKENGMLRPSKLADDLALIIDAEFGLVVVLGCGHHGIVNTLRHAQKITGNESIYAVIGGTHLIQASEERVEQTIADLKKMGIQKLGVSHCTGFHASVRLAQEFGDIFFLNNAGNRFTLP
jgi:7,8-dihydropterin-6-yl-methyl-4-(beta-D-ribofuranosyl)aminobenzene 5'-phosphate synthase